MKVMRMLVALSGALLSTGAMSATLRCDNCSEATMQGRATTSGLGVHHVYSVPTGIARKYEVTLECDENLNDGRTVCTRTAWPLPVEPEVTNFAIELAAYYQATGGTMKSYFTVITNGSAQDLSAFDVVGPGGPRNQLIDWFNSTQLMSIHNALPGLGAATHSIVVTVASMWNDSIGNTLVTVQFSDGSQVTLSYEPINGTVTVVPGSAKDRYGNMIPATVDDLNGARFDYTREGPGAEAQNRMINYISLFGISLSGSGRKWVCVRVGGGGWNCAYI